MVELLVTFSPCWTDASGGALRLLAVSMQCANLLKKRGLQEEEQLWSCTAKRRCLEAELRVIDCPMETAPSPVLTNQQQAQQVGVVWGRPPALCCPRCLNGEPGHINHILGHWSATLLEQDQNHRGSMSHIRPVLVPVFPDLHPPFEPFSHSWWKPLTDFCVF